MADLILRILLAPCLFVVTCIWFNVVLGIVSNQQNANTQQLSDPTMVALLATTTGNVIGLLYVVINSLFPNNSIAAKNGSNP